MSFLGSLFGSSSKATSNQTTNTSQVQNQTTNQNQQTTQNQTQATNTSQAQNTAATTGQTGSSVTSSLDAGTLSLLQNLIPQLAGNLNPSGSSVDLSAIRTSAAGLSANANTDISGMIKAQQDQARQDFAQGQGAQIAGLQRQIGSKGNTFSALIEQQGQAQLETTLAKIASDVTMNARAQSDQELAASAGASANAGNLALSQTAGPLQNLIAAISALSQGQQITSSSQAGTSNTASTGTGVSTTDTQSISDLISALTSSGTASASSVTTGAQKNSSSTGGILGDILVKLA